MPQCVCVCVCIWDRISSVAQAALELMMHPRLAWNLPQSSHFSLLNSGLQKQAHFPVSSSDEELLICLPNTYDVTVTRLRAGTERRVLTTDFGMPLPASSHC